MKEKIQQIKVLIEEILQELERDEPIVELEEEDREFAFLKKIMESDSWPEAVHPSKIADDNSEQDKEERAYGICDVILPPLVKKRFLDFGCGEGHVANHASKEADFSVGYDITRPNQNKFVWEEKQENLFLTTCFDKAKELGPYDVVLIYDVLDHVENNDMTEVLVKAASVLSEEGRIYVRCHPWCSRHGGHAYKKINKAFIHLVFSEDELKKMGVEMEPNVKVTNPIRSYVEAIAAAGLQQINEPEIDSCLVEDFFKENTIIRQRILNFWGVEEWNSDPPTTQMSQSFVDYILKR